jgi:hypothetical protein
MTVAKKEKLIPVSLRLPTPVIAMIDAVVQTGILGSTREEVTLHILREHIFCEMVTMAARKEKS